MPGGAKDLAAILKGFVNGEAIRETPSFGRNCSHSNDKILQRVRALR
jgi:hypothetical protein